MKTPRLWQLLLSIAAILLAASFIGGCKLLMAPAARAFGVPAESELAKCRAALRQLQAGLETTSIEIAAVLTVDEHRGVWRRPLAVMLQNEVATRTHARLTQPTQRPTVEPTPFGHNQLRYLWTRAADYTKAIQQNRPPTDFVLQAEIFSHAGKVTAMHLFVFTADGQVAYCRLYNSHHFGADFRSDDRASLEFMVRHLFEDLRRDAADVFPPHGVG